MKKTITLFALLSMFLLAASSCTEEKYRKYEGDGNTPDNPDNPGNPVTPDKIYRGIGINHGAIAEADFQRMAGWGVNHVRWNFENWTESYHSGKQTAEEYLDWIGTECNKLETALPFLEAAGITVNIDIHHPPGGKNANGAMRLFTSLELQEAFIEGWERIAERFKDSRAIVYYDLLNEPNVGSLGYNCKDWRDLAIATAASIREIDDTKKFIYEPLEDFYRNLQPLPGDDWVYSIHVYVPHLLTHQGVLSSAPYPGPSYPGNITGGQYNWPDAPLYWDKSVLRRYLDEIENVFDFARSNSVEIYVGEFGCARWAPDHSAYNYIRDCLEIFEEEGWHWSYFTDYSYASGNFAANSWSCQYDEVYNSGLPVDYETDRLKLLKSYWAKNSD
jgi:hypothetical protein